MQKKKKYKAFISYRKKFAVNADLIKKSVVDEGAYEQSDIFLDKHDIGPEFFDTKIKNSIIDSSCFILIVSKDCFEQKQNEEDWYIKEIKTAIEQKMTIIPILFDDIKSLNDSSVLSALKKTFSDQEISILQRSQAISYNFEYSEATTKKIVKFINKANKSKLKISHYLCAVGVIATILLIFFLLCFGIGFGYGYISSSSDIDSVMEDNTRLVENTLVFDFCGLTAEYNLNKDSIIINNTNFNGEPKISDFDLLVSSCTFSGAWTLFKNNVKSLKNIKLKGKSQALALVGACIGAFCGFSQGSKYGQQKKQEETALALYPQLLDKAIWKSMINKYVPTHFSRQIYLIQCNKPNSLQILLEYNNWNINSTNYNLHDEIDKSKGLPKTVVVYYRDTNSDNTVNIGIKHFELTETENISVRKIRVPNEIYEEIQGKYVSEKKLLD